MVEGWRARMGGRGKRGPGGGGRCRRRDGRGVSAVRSVIGSEMVSSRKCVGAGRAHRAAVVRWKEEGAGRNLGREGGRADRAQLRAWRREVAWRDSLRYRRGRGCAPVRLVRRCRAEGGLISRDSEVAMFEVDELGEGGLGGRVVAAVSCRIVCWPCAR